MPNTLAHVGVQSLLTRSVLRDADPRWIYLGCIIPDVPWMLQRVVKMAIPGIDPYTLRAYAIAQASLFGCLILCAALVLITRQSGKIYLILGLNAFLHLVLDACQIKWANGVHFLAPFSWEMTNWGFFWPESLLNYVLTGLGLVYILWQWRRNPPQKQRLTPFTARSLIWSSILIVAYFLSPLLFVRGPEAADNHYLDTLRTRENRQEHYVEIDRARYVNTPQGDVLRGWIGEDLRATGLDLNPPATVSVRGTFVTTRELHVSEHHVHLAWFRDGASYLGLALIVISWIMAWMRSPFARPDTSDQPTL